MTKREFVEGIAYLAVGVQTELPPRAIDVYYDMLGDLPAAVFRVACQRVLLSHRWKTFPSIAELREAAAETQRGLLVELSSGEAWALAWGAAAKIDPEVEGGAERGCAGVPPLVLEAMRAFGIPALCYCKDPIGVMRGQFCRIFDALVAREKRLAELPSAIQAAIRSHGDRPQSIGKVIAQIGVEERQQPNAVLPCDLTDQYIIANPERN